MNKEVKYIFEVSRPKEDFKVRNKAKTIKQLANRFNVKYQIGFGYFKGCRFRFRCVIMKGNKIIKELEKYKYRNGRIYGFFTNWEEMGK